MESDENSHYVGVGFQAKPFTQHTRSPQPTTDKKCCLEIFVIEGGS